MLRKPSNTAAAPSADLPDEVLCPLTHELMVDPVITALGQTYERAMIERWLEKRDTDPLTGEKLPHKALVPNGGIGEGSWENNDGTEGRQQRRGHERAGTALEVA